MKTSKSLIKHDFEFEVASKSHPGRTYIVGWDEGDKWTCTCIAGQMGRSCRHIRIKKHELQGLNMDTNELEFEEDLTEKDDKKGTEINLDGLVEAYE